jgi:hypothetical protein
MWYPGPPRGQCRAIRGSRTGKAAGDGGVAQRPVRLRESSHFVYHRRRSFNRCWFPEYPSAETVDHCIRHQFVDFTGTYVLHCHILAHEDRGMMQLFRVVEAGQYPNACQANIPQHN